MKAYIPYILSAWLVIGFTFSAAEKVFPQTNQKENEGKTTSSITAVPDEDSSYVTGITTGRANALGAAVLGLVSLVIGWRAKRRSSGRGAGSGRTGAIGALVLGFTGILLSVGHLSTTAGAVFGSGSGKAGAIVAIVFASIGTTLGWLALRFRNTNK